MSYFDFSNLKDTLTVAYAEVPNKQLIDTTEIGINDKKQTWAITFRVGNDWLTTPGKEFTPAFRYYHEFTQQGRSTYQNIGAHQRNNKISFGYTFDYFTGLEIDPKNFKPYRNRWLGLVSSTSDTIDDFENWNCLKQNNPHQYCVRNLLVDIETKTIIGKVDNVAYNIKDRVDLTQSWYATDNLYRADDDYHDRRFLLLGKTDKHTQAEHQLQILSAWVAIGSCLDPIKFWPDLTGSNLQEEINETRAWSTLEFNNQSTKGYDTEKQFIKSNSRWPDICWTTKLYSYN